MSYPCTSASNPCQQEAYYHKVSSNIIAARCPPGSVADMTTNIGGVGQCKKICPTPYAKDAGPPERCILPGDIARKYPHFMKVINDGDPTRGDGSNPVCEPPFYYSEQGGGMCVECPLNPSTANNPPRQCCDSGFNTSSTKNLAGVTTTKYTCKEPVKGYVWK